MTNRSSPTLPTCPHRLVRFASLFTTISGILAAAPLGAQSPATQQSPTPTQVPGIPNRPDLVTLVPFYWKPNETEAEKTKVVIQAQVDGAYGIFVVDLGDPDFDLNRTFLQPSPSGGVDTVTNAHRIPENGTDSIHVKVRIGTLSTDPVNPMIKANDPHHTNAFLNHAFGNFSWVFAPRLGNIGLSVLEPFETIVDYTHRCLVLIRLDKAGHRLVKVPSYTPKWTAPLIDVGNDGTKEWESGMQWWGVHVKSDMNVRYTLDLKRTTNNTELRAIDTGAPDNGDDLVGYPFLSRLGVVGFNHRTHQFILYR